MSDKENICENTVSRFGFRKRRPSSKETTPTKVGLDYRAKSLQNSPSNLASVEIPKLIELAKNIFDNDEECNKVIKAKSKRGKFEYKEKIADYEAIMKDMRKAISSLLEKKDLFIEQASQIEMKCRTIINERTDLAQEVSRKRKRVVEDLEITEREGENYKKQILKLNSQLDQAEKQLNAMKEEVNKSLQWKRDAQLEMDEIARISREKDTMIINKTTELSKIKMELNDEKDKLEKILNQTQLEYENLKNNNQILLSQHSKLEEKSEELSNENKVKNDKLMELTMELQQIKSEYNDNMRNDTMKISTLEKNQSENEEKISELSSKISEYEKIINNNNEVIEEYKQRIQNLSLNKQETEQTMKSEIQAKTIEINNLIDLKEKLTTELNEVRNNYNEKCDSLNELYEKKKEMEMKVMENNKQYDIQVHSLTKDNEKLGEEISKYEEKTFKLENRIEQMTNQMAEKDNIILGLKGDIQENNFKYNDLKKSSEMEYNNLVKEYDSYKEHVEKEIENMKEQHSQEVDNLQQQIETGSESIQKTIRDLTEQSQNQKKQIINNNAKITELSTKLNEANNSNVLLQNKVSQCEREITRLEVEKESLGQQIQSTQNTLNQLLDNNSQAQKFHEKTLSDMNNEKNELSNQINKLTLEKQQFINTEHKLNDQIKDLTRELQEKINALTQTANQLNETTNQLNILQCQYNELNDNYNGLNNQHVQLSEQYNYKVNEYEALKSEYANATKSYEDTMTALQKQHSAEIVEAKNQIQLLTQTNNQLTESINVYKEREYNLSSELENVKNLAGASEKSKLEKLCSLSQEAETLRKQVADKEIVYQRLEHAEQLVRTLQSECYKNDLLRRKLHNDIQDLKGNIRVIARVRPISKSDNSQYSDSPVDCAADGTELTLCDTKGKKNKFIFDKVFDCTKTQVDIFEEVSQLVQSALDGYNVCLFTYGQTGSGKTFTIQGKGIGDNRGIIPRSIEKVMEQCRMLENQGWKYTTEVTFLEIYNENIRDLLSEGSDENQNLQIKMDSDNHTYIPGLTRVKVDTTNEIKKLMAIADKHRAVGTTAMNERSSRSHSVFTLQIRGENESEKVVVTGALNLCDLAGSERLSRSQATGSTLVETKHINKSLSALSDVFLSISQNNKHIPFRNSKLTYLLQTCLSGEGKTLMIVNLSPTFESYNETLCSLRFASQVNSCIVGKAKKQISKC